MSLVSTYVYATDGLFYRDPVIRGEGYFICFDDNDPPELVMMEKHPCKAEEVLAKAQKILLKEGLSHSLDQRTIRRSSRCFNTLYDKEKKLRLKPAVAIFFQLLAPIPPPKGMTGVKIPKQECTVEGISYREYAKLKESLKQPCE